MIKEKQKLKGRISGNRKLIGGSFVQKGADGFSPVVNVEAIESGHRVTIKDKNSVNSFPVFNGAGAIVETKYGSTFTVHDAAFSLLGGLVVYGKTVQITTPSPNFRVPLKNAGAADGNISVRINDAEGVSVVVNNGLPGIPMQAVCQKHNYTDANGQKWFTDEIDLERGVYIQRCFTLTFDGTEDWKTASSGTPQIGSVQIPELEKFDIASNAPDNGQCCYHRCSHFLSVPRSGSRPDGSLNSYGGANGNTLQFRFGAYTGNIDGWKAWLAEQAAAGTPVTVLLGYKKPVETALPTEVVEQYRQMKTLYGSNTFNNSGNADMKVTYVADTKLYIDNKFNELAAAIVNNT